MSHVGRVSHGPLLVQATEPCKGEGYKAVVVKEGPVEGVWPRLVRCPRCGAIVPASELPAHLRTCRSKASGRESEAIRAEVRSDGWEEMMLGPVKVLAKFDEYGILIKFLRPEDEERWLRWLTEE